MGDSLELHRTRHPRQWVFPFLLLGGGGGVREVVLGGRPWEASHRNNFVCDSVLDHAATPFRHFSASGPLKLCQASGRFDRCKCSAEYLDSVEACLVLLSGQKTQDGYYVGRAPPISREFALGPAVDLGSLGTCF